MSLRKTRDVIQQEALEIAIRNKNTGLSVSMGVGKTLIGLRYLDHFQNLNMGKLNVLVVAPKLSIFDSWKSDSLKFGISMDKVTFTTYLSLNKHNPGDYDLLILDECHSLLPNHRSFLGMFTGRILGLTGTPPRYAKSDKGQIVQDYCPILYKYITDDAVEDNILNDYRIIVHRMSLSERNDLLVKSKKGQFYSSEKKNYDYWTKRILNASSKKEEQIASVMRMRAMMNFPTKEIYALTLLMDIQEKCIVFCNTQEQADLMCGHSYHANNPDSEENLQKFKDGKILELSCVLQLNEGVNIPELRAGIILHAYGNERKSSQRIGRLLRLNPDDTAMVHILCYADTVDERWVHEALKDLDPAKIKYHQLTREDESALYR
jgi:superfamily II DNA or RNA helicase